MFSEIIKLTQNKDGSFTIAFALREDIVIAKIISRSQLEQLHVTIEEQLKGL